MKRRSFSQYRSIDLSLMAVILAVLETVIVLAAGTWFPTTLYTVSIVGVVTAMVMIRWGAWAAIHALLGAVVFCTVSGGSPQQYLIYCAGNLFSLLSLLLIRLVGKERISRDPVVAMVFGICTQLFMQLGRAAVAMLLGWPFATAMAFVTTDSLSLLFAMVVIWIARKQDGLLEDQREYIHRINQEQLLEEEKANETDGSGFSGL